MLRRNIIELGTGDCSRFRVEAVIKMAMNKMQLRQKTAGHQAFLFKSAIQLNHVINVFKASKAIFERFLY